MISDTEGLPESFPGRRQLFVALNTVYVVSLAVRICWVPGYWKHSV